MEESAIPPLLGIIGQEIAGNPTQFAMERLFAATDMDWRFLSFAVDPGRLEDSIRGVDALGFRGIAIAPSFSRMVGPLLNQLAQSSELSGWTDVVVRASGGEFQGYNIIGEALLDWLGKDQLAGSHLMVLGETSKSLAMARLLQRSELQQVIFRDAKPEIGADRIRAGALAEQDWASCEILIRASISDEKPDPAPISEVQIDQLPSTCAVVDLATCAGTSPLLRYAAGRGLRTLSAIDLMVARSSIAFQMWTGTDADQTLLREAFEEYLEI